MFTASAATLILLATLCGAVVVLLFGACERVSAALWRFGHSMRVNASGLPANGIRWKFAYLVCRYSGEVSLALMAIASAVASFGLARWLI